MIKNIIFDFGDIFVNLDKEAIFREMTHFGFKELTPEIDTLAKHYEVGQISSDEFINKLNLIFPKATPEKIRKAWNSIILDFPLQRLEFIEALTKEGNFRLFLLSNTNELHINFVKDTMGKENYNRFKDCFEQFYLSHEINLRKPNQEIYAYVLRENRLIADETLFIDDTQENTDSANELGIHCWHLHVGKQDITDLKAKL